MHDTVTSVLGVVYIHAFLFLILDFLHQVSYFVIFHLVMWFLLFYLF